MAENGTEITNMPTGYTNKIYEGEKITFQEFALTCARAFGALVMMRDEDSDAEIPDEFKPSLHHANKIREARELGVAFAKHTEAIWERLNEAAYQAELTEYQRSVKKNDEREKRYRSMMKEVQRWTPPSADHEGMKKFMLEQLQQSIEFDCHTPHKPQRRHWSVYKAKRITDVARDIEYHTKEYLGEVKRATDRTEWVRALRESLGVKA